MHRRRRCASGAPGLLASLEHSIAAVVADYDTHHAVRAREAKRSEGATDVARGLQNYRLDAARVVWPHERQRCVETLRRWNALFESAGDGFVDRRPEYGDLIGELRAVAKLDTLAKRERESIHAVLRARGASGEVSQALHGHQHVVPFAEGAW